MDFKIGDQVVFTKVAKIISEHPPVYEVRYRKEAGQVVHECQMIKPTKQQLINGSN